MLLAVLQAKDKAAQFLALKHYQAFLAQLLYLGFERQETPNKPQNFLKCSHRSKKNYAAEKNAVLLFHYRFALIAARMAGKLKPFEGIRIVAEQQTA